VKMSGHETQASGDATAVGAAGAAENDLSGPMKKVLDDIRGDIKSIKADVSHLYCDHKISPPSNQRSYYIESFNPTPCVDKYGQTKYIHNGDLHLQDDPTLGEYRFSVYYKNKRILGLTKWCDGEPSLTIDDWTGTASPKLLHKFLKSNLRKYSKEVIIKELELIERLEMQEKKDQEQEKQSEPQQ